MKHRAFLALASFALLHGCATTSPEDQASQEGKDCHSPLGYIPNGGAAVGYLAPSVPPGQTCVSGQLICFNGVWTGAYIHPACTTQP